MVHDVKSICARIYESYIRAHIRICIHVLHSLSFQTLTSPAFITCTSGVCEPENEARPYIVHHIHVPPLINSRVTLATHQFLQ